MFLYFTDSLLMDMISWGFSLYGDVIKLCITHIYFHSIISVFIDVPSVFIIYNHSKFALSLDLPIVLCLSLFRKL